MDVNLLEGAMVNNRPWVWSTLSELFFENFKDLLEIAKPLL